MITASKAFQLPQLETICENHKREEEFLNPSIGTYLNDLTGASMKKMFLNKDNLADISFKIEGKFI